MSPGPGLAWGTQTSTHWTTWPQGWAMATSGGDSHRLASSPMTTPGPPTSLGGTWVSLGLQRQPAGEPTSHRRVGLRGMLLCLLPTPIPVAWGTPNPSGQGAHPHLLLWGCLWQLGACLGDTWKARHTFPPAGVGWEPKTPVGL